LAQPNFMAASSASKPLESFSSHPGSFIARCASWCGCRTAWASPVRGAAMGAILEAVIGWVKPDVRVAWTFGVDSAPRRVSVVIVHWDNKCGRISSEERTSTRPTGL
jgi:hypothetical protein